MRNRRRWGVLLISLTVAAPACGPQEPGADYVLLRPNGDLLSGGETVERSESVTGDAMLVGGSIDFSGDVGGSYLGASGEQQVRGRIEGSGRAVGGSVRFGASVGRNVTLAGGNVELLEGALVERNAYLAGGLVEVDGTVLGDLYAGAREFVLDGTVEGDVRVEAEQLRIGPSARIEGDLTYRVEGELASIDSEASIGGDVDVLAPREGVGPGGVVMSVLRVLTFIVTAGVLVALFPGTASRMSAAVRVRPVAALGLGLLWAVAVPVVILVTAVTLVGIPLALILAAIYVASVYLAPAVPAMWLGELLLPSRTESERAKCLKSFLIGGPLVGIAILLPWAGLVVRLVAGLLGLGAILMLLIEERSR